MKVYIQLKGEAKGGSYEAENLPLVPVAGFVEVKRIIKKDGSTRQAFIAIDNIARVEAAGIDDDKE